MKPQYIIRFAAASIIVGVWVFVELAYGRIADPTLELRIIVFCSIVYLFGETTVEAVLDILNRNKEDNK